MMTDNQSGTYLGMPLQIDAADHENLAYFQYCADGDFRLQQCSACAILRYPPTTGCPWCGHEASTWTAVEGRGTVYTYAEVHHAIQPAFRAHLPYLIVIVELDTQQGKPKPADALRVAGNLVTADGELAPPDQVESVGVGSRVRMVFKTAGDGIAIPNWTVDETAELTTTPWRYPD